MFNLMPGVFLLPPNTVLLLSKALHNQVFGKCLYLILLLAWSTRKGIKLQMVLWCSVSDILYMWWYIKRSGDNYTSIITGPLVKSKTVWYIDFLQPILISNILSHIFILFKHVIAEACMLHCHVAHKSSHGVKPCTTLPPGAHSSTALRSALPPAQQWVGGLKNHYLTQLRHSFLLFH